MKKWLLWLSVIMIGLINTPSYAGALKNYPDGDWYARNGIKCDNVVNFCTPVPDDAPYIYRITLFECTGFGTCPSYARHLYYKSHEILTNPNYNLIISHLNATYSQGFPDKPNTRFYKLDKCVKGTGTDGTTCDIVVSYYDKDGTFHTYSPHWISSTGIFNNAPCAGELKQGVCLAPGANDNGVNEKTVGDPISITNQEVVDARIDMKFPIEFARMYRSSNKQFSSLGFGWSSELDKSVRIPVLNNPSDNVNFSYATGSGANGETIYFPTTLLNTLWIQVQDGTNSDLFFTRKSVSEEWTGAFKNYDGYRLTNSDGQFVLLKPNGDKNIYDGARGIIVSEKFKNGSYLNYDHSGDKITKITNNYNQFISFNYNGERISQIIASNGDSVVYTYDNGYLTKATYNGQESYSYAYDSNGLMIDKYDENNQHYTHYDYDSKNRPIVNYMFDKEGNQINRSDLNYNNTSYVSETKQNGNVLYHYFDNYNSGNHFTGTQNITGGYGYYALGSKTYDTNGNLTRDYNPLGASKEYTYDTNNLVKSIRKENLGMINMTWDTNKRLLSTMSEQTGNGNRITSYNYDDNNNINSKVVKGNNETLDWAYSWSNDGRLLSKTEPNGLKYTYVYYPIDGTPSSGLIQTITTNTGKVITMNSYDSRGNTTSVTGIDGMTKSMVYDIRNRVTSETVNGATNTYTYDLTGNLIASNFANGYALNMVYDPSHRLIKIEDNMGGMEEFTLDSTTGKPLNTSIYQNSVLIKTMNQVLNDVGHTIKTYGSDSDKAYNYTLYVDGNVQGGTDPLGKGIYRSMYGRGLVQSLTYQDDATSYTYDYDNNLKTLTINNQITTYTYDDFGRLTQLISPDTGTQNLTYNTLTGVKTRTDPNGITHTTTSDIEGKVTSVVHSKPGGTLAENYEYNNETRLKKMTDSSGSTEFEYDIYGFLNKKTQTINGQNFDVAYENNNIGQTTSVKYPSGMIVNYTYDKGFLTSIEADSTTILNNVTYNSLEKQPVSWNLGNNTVTITRNTDGGQTGFVDTGILNQSLTIDAMLNIKAINDSINPNQNITANFTNNYSLYNFTSALGTQTYDSSANSNISSVTGLGVNSAWNYISGTNKINSFSNSPVVKYIYDNNGNLIVDNKGSYTYDLKNNMVSSTRMLNGVTNTGNYTFNAMNQRVAKNISGQVRYFVYNESNQLLGEYDSSGNVINEYIYFGLRPVAVKNNGSINMVHTDYLGTPRYVMDSGNTLLWKWENTDPFGANLAQGTLEFNIRFAGQYYDSESSLHYNMFRMYDPASKRYMQSDPIGLAGGNNTYNYVGRNPLNGVDPLGLVLKLSADNVAINNKSLQKMTHLPSGEKLLDSDAVILIHSNFLFKNDFVNDYLLNHYGGFDIRQNSQLYEDLKNTETFNKINTGGDIGVTGSTLAKMLNESKINLGGIKRIILLSCVAGATYNPKTGNLNAQDFADGMNRDILASENYLRLDLINGGVLTEGTIMFDNFSLQTPANSGTFNKFLPSNSIINKTINTIKGLFR